APQARFAFCQFGKLVSTSDRLKKPLVTFGPSQPSRHNSPLAASMVAAVRKVSFSFGTVPGRKNSLTVFVVNGPGLRPVKASTGAGLSACDGVLNWAILVPLVTSFMIADHRGAEVSSESLPSLGVLSLLPIQTPTA